MTLASLSMSSSPSLIVILVTAVIGALFGFLWFNCYPAEVFMGDSGSLSIGAFIGYMGIVTLNEKAKDEKPNYPSKKEITCWTPPKKI